MNQRLEKEIAISFPSPTIIVTSLTDKVTNSTEYKLHGKVINTDVVIVNKETVEINGEEFEKIVPLKSFSTAIQITAKNKYKMTETSLTIERDETTEEKSDRLLREQDAKKREEQIKKELEAERKKEEAEKATWEQSTAGRLCKKHPDWSNPECEAVAINKFWIGMSLDMLKAERGLPDSANPSNYGDGTQWQWCWFGYNPSCFYDDNGDYLIDSHN